MAWNTPKDEHGALFLAPEFYDGVIARHEAFRLMHIPQESIPITDLIEPGDWIVREADGVLSVFPPEAFEETFEAA